MEESNFKKKTPRSSRYLEFVRQQPSILSGCTYDVVAHHVRRGHGGGMGLKPSDFRTIPLTAEEHTILHQMGEDAFYQKHHLIPERAIIRLLCRFIRDDRILLEALEELAVCQEKNSPD